MAVAYAGIVAIGFICVSLVESASGGVSDDLGVGLLGTGIATIGKITLEASETSAETEVLNQLGNYGIAGVLAAILWYKLGKVEAVLYEIRGSLKRD